VVWFNENLPSAALSQAMAAAQRCDIFFSIGTSAVVQPAASLAHHARQYGATLVEINLEPTPLTRYVNFALHGPAGVILSRLIATIE
jgi:NAD-dependent deacetylase